MYPQIVLDINNNIDSVEIQAPDSVPLTPVSVISPVNLLRRFQRRSTTITSGVQNRLLEIREKDNEDHSLDQTNHPNINSNNNNNDNNNNDIDNHTNSSNNNKTSCIKLFNSNNQNISINSTSTSILIVDDSNSNRKMMRRVFESRYGCTCEEAVDGLEAVKAVFNTVDNGATYDLITIDYQMPNMDGPRAVKAVRDLGYEGVIVGLTGDTSQLSIEEFISHGANVVFTKPLDILGLETWLNNN